MNISMESVFGDQEVGRSKGASGLSQQMYFSRVRSHVPSFARVVVDLGSTLYTLYCKNLMSVLPKEVTT
jgi:hypothetical protein